jgi:hypothetical protein
VTRCFCYAIIFKPVQAKILLQPWERSDRWATNSTNVPRIGAKVFQLGNCAAHQIIFLIDSRICVSGMPLTLSLLQTDFDNLKLSRRLNVEFN